MPHADIGAKAMLVRASQVSASQVIDRQVRPRPEMLKYILSYFANTISVYIFTRVFNRIHEVAQCILRDIFFANIAAYILSYFVFSIDMVC